MPMTPLISQLCRLLDFAHDRQLAQVTALSRDEREEVGTPDHWSAKDHLAHTVFWRDHLVEVLAAVSRGETPTHIEDFLAANEANFPVFRDRSWDDVLGGDARSHAALRERLAALTDADLVDPTRVAWRDGDPMIFVVFGDSYWHTQGHLAQYLADRGDLDGATRVHATFVREIMAADQLTIIQGDTVYNFACFYAKTGRRDEAIAHLREALRMSPRLTEWSKEDPDFASLRDDLEYQALYAE